MADLLSSSLKDWLFGLLLRGSFSTVFWVFSTSLWFDVVVSTWRAVCGCDGSSRSGSHSPVRRCTRRSFWRGLSNSSPHVTGALRLASLMMSSLVARVVCAIAPVKPSGQEPAPLQLTGNFGDLFLEKEYDDLLFSV